MAKHFKELDIDYFKRSFFNTAVADVYRAIDGKCLIGAFILTFCLIDQMTWIEYGYELKAFNKWIINRLVPLNIFYTQKDEELYSVRCGLVHSYGPSKQILRQKFAGYELLQCSPEFHLQKVNSSLLKVCLYSLLTETAFAAHSVFKEFKLSIKKEQINRLEKLIIIKHQDPPFLFGDMHRALSAFDIKDAIELNNVKADYTAKIIYG
jgi:hypothetical protein